LGRLLDERRHARGFSRTRLGELCGVNPSTIEAWELGRVSRPPIHDVLRLARALGISLTEIEQAVFADVPLPATEPERGGPPLLEQVLETFGWDELELAHTLGVNSELVGAWRRGERAMTLPELMTVAALLGLHAASLQGQHPDLDAFLRCSVVPGPSPAIRSTDLRAAATREARPCRVQRPK
jgi:transcriptional regulator with XRE-family HTH domain